LTLAAAALAWGVAGPARTAEIDRIVEMMGLESGMTVADVGAGDGGWAVQLARRVGVRGHVWATEVDGHEIERIEERVHDSALDNITVVRGDQTSSGLPVGCCDAILLRLVYHHFQKPVRMRADLRRALRPGGRLVIIDIEPQSSWRDLPDVPDRGGHGIPEQELIDELTGDGFTVVGRQDDWNGDADRFCVVFRR
jgi:ubiquinone/menaquinone biosynthesis C-methylase UbiE